MSSPILPLVGEVSFKQGFQGNWFPKSSLTGPFSSLSTKFSELQSVLHLLKYLYLYTAYFSDLYICTIGMLL